jgi:hypothetical protein
MPFIGSIEGAMGYGRGPSGIPDTILTTQWANYFETVNVDNVFTTTDSVGNIYVTGSYNTSLTSITIKNVSGNSQGSSSYTLPGTGGSRSNIFLIKYSSAGQVLWATYFSPNGASSNTRAGGVVCDSSNNIYIAGYYAHTTTNITLRNVFGTGTTASTITLPLTGGTTSGYIIKYNSSGITQWATYFGYSHTYYLSDIYCYSNSLYIVGGMTSTTPITLQDASGNGQVNSPASNSLDSSSNTNMAVLLKYNTNGVSQWSTYIPILSNNIYITCDNNGNPILCASYYTNISTTNLKEVSLDGTTQTTSLWTITGTGSTSGSGAIIIKYSTAGLISWATSFNYSSPTAGLSYTRKLDTDSLNNIYITGYYGSTVTTALKNANSVTKNQTNSSVIMPIITTSPFLIKYDTNGLAQWGVNIFNGSSATAMGIGLIVNKSIGHVYVVGYYDPRNTITLFNANGNTQIASSVTLPTTSLTIGRMFIIKYSLDGIIKCATYVNSANANIFKGIDIAQYGNYLYVMIYCPGLPSTATPQIYNGTKNTQVLSLYTLTSSTERCGALIKYLG